LSPPRTFAALQHYNYRLWFSGQVVSLMGTWMQNTAQGFLIYELTKSPAYLGYVGFAAGMPAWIFTLYGGVIADRVSRRMMLIATQSSMMLLAFILAGLTFTNLVQPWHVLILAFALGIANAFDAPARQSFVAELVPRDDMTNAIALNSTMFNSASAVGPAIAGLTYALIGPGWCFTLNGISFLAVIAALAAMRLPKPEGGFRRGSTVSDLKEGLQYLFSHSTILLLIGMVGMVGFFGASFTNLFPAWAVQVLKGDAATNGLLRSALGLGSLVGALVIATFSTHKGRGKMLMTGASAYPAMLLVFVMVRGIPMALLILLLVGFFNIMVINLCNALIQTEVSDALRGRVMSVYTMVFFGFMPLGALMMGSLAERTSEPTAGLVGGGAMLLEAVLLWFFAPKLRKLE
jgi:MFS family permease